MTQEEAVTLAREFVVSQQRAVIPEPEAVRHMEADRFNRLLGRAYYPSDFWVVEFRKVLPPGVAAETPGSLLVEVIEATGQVRLVYVGMTLESRPLATRHYPFTSSAAALNIPPRRDRGAARKWRVGLSVNVYFSLVTAGGVTVWRSWRSRFAPRDLQAMKRDRQLATLAITPPSGDLAPRNRLFFRRTRPASFAPLLPV